MSFTTALQIFRICPAGQMRKISVGLRLGLNLGILG